MFSMLFVRGIIPARAGFTRSLRRRTCRPSDHPRSRGVYRNVTPTAGTRSGSSPLARGLRPARGHRPRPPGIIPARAGFTDSSLQEHHTNWDHPRSRGVYLRTVTTESAAAGSSPLARGLLPGDAPAIQTSRIIPARAGFTQHVQRVIFALRDHPRSRGVYAVPPALAARCRGSSPLARGLHQKRRRSYGPRGIIPARAGFTEGSDHPAWCRWDHPRSRGVYLPPSWRSPTPAGSSPLARGLRPSCPGWYWLRGIIPARAGFTRGAPRRCARRPDHPRSRGVYSSMGSFEWGFVGIIPARAGFTERCLAGTRCRTDHPRSRGVYPTVSSRLGRTPGSSPLARGLRRCCSPTTIQLRIIPARAGFTVRVGFVISLSSDHPRSRGVYLNLGDGVVGREGSSPLARGLLVLHEEAVVDSRIIPARAGFTQGCGFRNRRQRDHPRSRGVYSADWARCR